MENTNNGSVAVLLPAGAPTLDPVKPSSAALAAQRVLEGTPSPGTSVSPVSDRTPTSTPRQSGSPMSLVLKGLGLSPSLPTLTLEDLKEAIKEDEDISVDYIMEHELDFDDDDVVDMVVLMMKSSQDVTAHLESYGVEILEDVLAVDFSHHDTDSYFEDAQEFLDDLISKVLTTTEDLVDEVKEVLEFFHDEYEVGPSASAVEAALENNNIPLAKLLLENAYLNEDERGSLENDLKVVELFAE
ncbi:MAG: hypothetical protein MRY21_07535 [Simkaniaceae bacterium]|nr:hypothetical protein [Simkaniaceae bacterium]